MTRGSVSSRSTATSTSPTVHTLGADPAGLLPDHGSDLRAFTIRLDVPMGHKRSAATGSLIHSVRTVTTASTPKSWTTSGSAPTRTRE